MMVIPPDLGEEHGGMTLRNGLILGFVIFTLCGCHGQESKQEAIQDKADPIGTATTSISHLNHLINLVFQDSEARYWFAVKNLGIYRYDGSVLTHYSTQDGLISNHILSIQEDASGHLYFESFQGVVKFDGQSFTALEILDNAATHNAWVLEPGDLWFRLGWDKKGPFRYDGQFLYALKFPKAPKEEAFLAANPNASYTPYGIYAMHRDRHGNMWFGTTSLGVCRFDGNAVRWLYEHEMFNTPSGGEFGIRAILEDRQGHFWFNRTESRYIIHEDVSTSEGPSFLSYQKEPGVTKSKGQTKPITPYFLSMVEDKKGHFWMITYDEGVWHNDGTELIKFPVLDEGTSVLLFSIYQDLEGGLWVVSHKKGLFKFNGRTFEKFRLESLFSP